MMAEQRDPPPEADPVPLPGTHSTGKARVLIVDDDERTLEAVTTVLEDLGQTLVTARSGEEALRFLLHDDFAVILLDVQMPGMDGYETASFIRARRKTRHIPIVFLTAVHRDDIHLLQAYSAGAVDMVFKPVDSFVLKSKVSIFVELYLKQAEIERQSELRHALRQEYLRVRLEKLSAEEALRKVEAREQSILRAVPICCHSRSTEPPYNIDFIGSTIEKLTGFPAERFMADPHFGMGRIHPDDIKLAEDAFRDIAKTKSYSWEFRWRCVDDSYRIFLDQGVLSSAEGDEQPQIVGTLVDVTEERLLQQQLSQAQKMEAVGRLTGGIAHDFNNLLTVILGNLELLAPKLKDNARIVRQLSAMQQAAERGRSLTGQLLAFSRRQQLRPELFDLNLRIHSFAGLLDHALGEQVALELSLDEEAVPCELDPAQLEISLLNLAMNARDAMPDGGRLKLSVSQSIRQFSDLPKPPSGQWILLTVSDNGTGMPQEIATRAFEPFFTTKDIGRGSGLGLSQVYGFVNQSGGHVALDSTPGEGTVISIYLPLSTKPLPEAAPSPVCLETSDDLATGTVLLVEDDASVLDLANELLLELGYRVIPARDANAALEILRNGDPIDVIFTDVVMSGGKTGVQLAQEAREMRPGIKILLTSGYTGEALGRHGIDQPDLPIIGKPFQKAALGAKLRGLVASGPGA